MTRAHEHNWPVKGALMRNPEHADITGASNCSTTTTGSWVTITANSKTLQIVITPDADCRVEVVLRAQMSHSAANPTFALGVDVNGSSAGRSIAPTIMSAGTALSMAPVLCEFAASAGTTYTITGKVLNSTAGTLTVYAGSVLTTTEMYIKVFKKPEEDEDDGDSEFLHAL